MRRLASATAVGIALAVLGAGAIFGGASVASGRPNPASRLPTLGCVVETNNGGSIFYRALRRPRDCATQSAASFKQNGLQLYSYSETEIGEMRWSSWTARTAHGKGYLEGVMGGPVPIEVWLSRPVKACPPGVVAPQTDRTFSRMLTKTRIGGKTVTNLSVLPTGYCQANVVA